MERFTEIQAGQAAQVLDGMLRVDLNPSMEAVDRLVQEQGGVRNDRGSTLCIYTFADGSDLAYNPSPTMLLKYRVQAYV